jgi:hypothetical protein
MGFASVSVNPDYLSINVIPALALAHEATGLVQALCPATAVTPARHKLDDTGVARLFGVAHFQSQPLEGLKLQIARRS